MQNLEIFGATIVLQQGVFKGALGGLKNSLEISSKAAGVNVALTCRFEGALPLGKLSNTQWQMECEAVGDKLVARKAVLKLGGKLYVDDIGFPVRNTNVIGVTTSMRPGHSVLFTTDQAMLNEMLARMVGGNVVRIGAKSIDEGFAIAPDFAAADFAFEPTGEDARVTVDHHYTTAAGELFRSGQELGFRAVRVNSTAVTVLASSPRLYVQGDLVEKRPAKAENQVFFQHALVNGELHVSARHDDPQRATLMWAPEPGKASPPVLLALRWRDENGHPLALHPESGSFDLTERVGFSEVPGGSSEFIELTNCTVGVTGAQTRNWRLRALCPISHYRDDEDLYPHYGPVELAGAPREVHGLALGVVLHVPRQDAGGLPCTFACRDVKHEDRLIASLPEIALGGNGAQWKFQAFLEERDSRAAAALSAREAVGKAAASGPVLPLVDPQPMGVNLHPAPGDKVDYKGQLVQELGAWLAEHDKQFVGSAPQWLDAPPMPRPIAQVHRSGFSLLPADDRLHRVLDQMRTTGNLTELVPASPRLATGTGQAAHLLSSTGAVTGYVHGVRTDQDFDAKVHALEDRLSKAPVWNEAWVRVMNNWVAPPLALGAVYHEVRALLNVTSSLPPPLDVDLDDGSVMLQWMEFKTSVAEMAAMGDFDDIDILEGDTLSEALDAMDVQEFADQCIAAVDAPPDDPVCALLPLLHWLDAPMGPEMFRRVVRLLLDAKVNPGGERYRRLNKVCTDAQVQLPAFVADLLGTDFLNAAADLFGNLKGFLTDLGLGESNLLQQARGAWDRNTSGAFDNLRRRWGPALTDDLLDKIAADAQQAAELLHSLALEGVAVYDVADLVRRPPEYLFATRRFASAGSDWDKAMRLWSGRFGLANLSEKIHWHFFLGDKSTLIVKLGDRRGIDAVLMEAHERFRTEQRPDPLGLAELDSAKQKTVAGGLALLKQKLGSSLLAPSWTGLLILRPTADISDDLKLRDLCGLEYIDALFVAVAGRPLDNDSLDISAAVESRSVDEAVAELKDRDPDKWNGDVDFGLTRFSVVIRRSVLDAADIAFQLRVKNLMGKEHPDNPGDPAVQAITIRGTLPPADPANPDKARDIQFAAVLEPPMRIPIGFLCFEEVAFAGLHVAVRDGRTHLDIDADLKFKNTSASGYSDFLESLEQLKLRGFRIALPSLQPGEARSIGEAIGLDFEWPSVQFSAPRSRGIKLFGLEITPLGLGILRKAAEDWSQFKANFVEVENWGLPALGNLKTEVPHIRFRAAFGSLPALGVSGKLSFDLVFGLLVVNGVPQHPFVAVEGVEANKITIDLFRLITITIEKLIFKQNWTFRLPGHTDIRASGLVADRVELKVMNWNPLGKGGQLSLASFHRTDNHDDYQPHSFVIGYEKSLDAGKKSDSFVKIHWIVLGQNIELRKEAYDYLLGSGSQNLPPTTEMQSMLTELLVYKEKEHENAQLPEPQRKKPELVDGTLVATFTKSPSWLFGISFSLGEILELGNLVLHDQHYYGIRLRDRRWVQAVFGQDTIEFAYIPGARRELDRFRTNLRIPMLDMLGPMTGGEIALEWAVNWDFLIDIGFPWKTTAGHNWFRAFSLPVGTYEGKFGFYLEKKTTYDVVPDTEVLMLACGAALYVGLYAGYGNSVAFVRAGIGVFGIFEGRFWLKNANLSRPDTLLKATIVRMEVSGTIGIFAYAEGRIEVWIISASFRAWAEASLTTTVIYVPNATCAIAYTATLAAGYSASVRVGSGWFSWTFSVSGSLAMPVSGRLLLS